MCVWGKKKRKQKEEQKKEIGSGPPTKLLLMAASYDLHGSYSGPILKSINEERDLGELMSKDLKFSKQCPLAKNKANLMLGI